ncbi:hypothetical protein ACWGJ2_02970 [Streptomyces sp. NPDC054796]
MTTETAREPANTKDTEQRGKMRPAWGWRVLGLLFGFVLTVGGAAAVVINVVQGAQATGLAGERGTFTVAYCTDKNPSGKNSDYECDGAFVPQGGEAADRRSGTLENAGDYPDGRKLDVTENMVGSPGVFRETGVGAVLASLMWMCFGVIALAAGVYQSRKWLRSFG